MSKHYDTIEFSPKTYDFVGIVSKLFEVDDLSLLHESTDEKYVELFEVGKDSSTVFHKKFYDTYHEGWPELQNLYDRFIAENIQHNIHNDTEGFLYQKFPTFRVHLPNNVAVGRFHRDSEFGHPPGEINFIIPLTNSENTASVWMESEPYKMDFVPMKLEIGKLYIFNGNELAHGNMTNLTDKTRVSMDFRIIPLSKYNQSEQKESLTRKTKFIEGEYYKR